MDDIKICPHFNECGGCQTLDQEYAMQIRKKEEFVKIMKKKTMKSCVFLFIFSEYLNFRRNDKIGIK